MGSTVGEVQANPYAKRIALECAKEADMVARKKGITLSYHSNGEDGLQTYVEKFASTVLGAVPSMAQDFIAGRKGEVDAQNGAIPVEAEKVGLLAPVNQTVADLIRAKECAFER